MNANSDSVLDGSSPLKNARHEAFAQSVADGNASSDAYREVYKVKASVARANAARLLAKASVRARVDFLQAENAATRALTRERKREILAKIAEDEGLDARARISAIQEDNRMTGEGEDTLNLKGGAFVLKWDGAKNV